MNKIIKIFKEIILKRTCKEYEHHWNYPENNDLFVTRKCSKCSAKEYYNSYYSRWKKMF